MSALFLGLAGGGERLCEESEESPGGSSWQALPGAVSVCHLTGPSHG